MAGRRYYSEYVGHFVRFYLMYPNAERFKSDMEKTMYNAVGTVWSEMLPAEKDILKRLFLAKPFNAEVDKVAEELALTASSIWKLVLRFEDEIARVGGLL